MRPGLLPYTVHVQTDKSLSVKAICHAAGAVGFPILHELSRKNMIPWSVLSTKCDFDYCKNVNSYDDQDVNECGIIDLIKRNTIRGVVNLSKNQHVTNEYLSRDYWPNAEWLTAINLSGTPITSLQSINNNIAQNLKRLIANNLHQFDGIDNEFMMINKHFPKLEHLELRNCCDRITKYTVQNFEFPKELKVLDLRGNVITSAALRTLKIKAKGRKCQVMYTKKLVMNSQYSRYILPSLSQHNVRQ